MWSSPAITLSHTHEHMTQTHRMEISSFQHTGIWCVMMTSFSHIYICLLHSYHTNIEKTGTRPNTQTEEIHKHRHILTHIYAAHTRAVIWFGSLTTHTRLHRNKHLYRTEWTLGLFSDQVGHLLTGHPASTFKMVHIDLSISVCIFLFQSLSHSAMTNPPPLVNVAVAYAAFKWGGINPSNNMAARSSGLEAVMYSNPWWWKFPADFCLAIAFQVKWGFYVF